jgi:hypothetical protein
MSTYTDYSSPSSSSDTGRASGWHTVNIGHLVMGLAFLGLVAVWGAVQLDLVPDDDVRWLLPLPWVFAGAAGLIATGVAGGLRWRRSAATLVAPPAPAYDEPLTPDHTSDIDEKLARYESPEEDR